MQIRMLREIDAMFEGTPQTRKTLEVKEEMLQNLMEKYSDLLAEGRSEEAAFNIAIGSVGDISDLLAELSDPPKVATFPEPDLSDYDDYTATASAVPADDTAWRRHHNAVVVSVAVMLYILSPVAVIAFGNTMGLILLFAMIAGATGLLIYNSMANPKADKAQQVSAAGVGDEFPAKMSKRDKRLFGSLSSALWLITVSLYMVISFSTSAWHITWIIFLIAAAASNVLKAFLDLNRR